MCGYIGEISLKPINKDFLIQSNLCQVCRGPDETKYLEKVVGDQNYNLSLLFNRLSIIDLSEAASQPMISKDFGTLITFNGEVYNHSELRKALEKSCNFETNHSDTEVLLNGLSLEGPKFLNKVRGQFSIVFIDPKNNKVLMARDRLGQKPLFYKYSKNSLTFSTNLKSLVKQTSSDTIDEKQVINYLNFGVVPSPHTIFKNINKVKPSNTIVFDLSKDIKIIEDSIYWEPESYINNNDFDQKIFIEKFKESLEYRLVSDVPVSTFLSGGLDSSSITKGLYEIDAEVNTFSVTHEDKKYDESLWINQVTKKYETNHTEIQINQDNIDNQILNAINSLDEPYSDPSVIPSFVLSQIISKKYKVALSGDGGDELLGGYKRFQNSFQNKNHFKNLASKMYTIYPGYLGSGSNLLMNSKDQPTSYFSSLEDDKFIKMLGLENNTSLKGKFYEERGDSFKSLMLAEYSFFLSEMMCLKIDRTSMSNSLEVRSPFLDHKLIEYVLSSKMSDIVIPNAKQPLKKYLGNDFSHEFINRKKMGFSFNVENWVYKNKEFINDTLNKGEIAYSIDPNILKKLSIYKSRINSHRIWKLLVLEIYIKSIKN